MGFTASSQRVLLVEDDEQSRSALQLILEDAGFEVRVAADGGEGITLVPAFQPDVIVLDLVLPGLNGFDAAKLLKGDSATSTIPLVAVTASWLGSESGRLRQIGFDGALRKPFTGDALVNEVRKVLQH
jgi:CheY-like chemotaxis protein